MDPRTMPLTNRVKLLVESLDGSEDINEALSRCNDGQEMLDVLLGASAKLGLGLTKDDLLKTPPIRDWIWYKDGGALLTVGDGVPRYQQDKNSADLRFIGGGVIVALLFILGMLTGF